MTSTTPEIVSIPVLEALQAGDVFLFKFNCPKCGQDNLASTAATTCDHCDYAFIEPFVLPTKRQQYTLLAGTRRKTLRNKRTMRKLLDMQERKCAYCFIHLEGTDFEIEHIIPLAAGGSNNMDNLAAACKRCNGLASSFVFFDYATKRNFILRRIKEKQY